MDLKRFRIIPLARRLASGARFPAGVPALSRLTMRALVDLILPDQCRLCAEVSDQAGYCARCAARLPRHDRQCRICGVPFTGGAICGRCQRQPPPILETIAPFQYAPPVSDDIHQLKYHRKLACGRDLGTLLARELARRASWRPDVLVPVPLHWKRRFRRGFNQSVEIAVPVSRALDVPIDLNLVERRVHTAPQVGLMPAQRRRNTRRAFRATEVRKPESAAIVDDVITSGSTVSEVAHCLRRSGVKWIVVWALTRV